MKLPKLLVAASLLAISTLVLAGIPQTVAEPETLAPLAVGSVALVIVSHPARGW